ncbi:MAG: alpha/beta hydrolase fold domain-containing protein [Verrucomicrobiia bacterium]
MIRRRLLTVCLCLAALLRAAHAADDSPKGAAAPRVSDEQLQQYLKRYPDADANKDGKLTFEEARAYLKKLRKSGQPQAGKGASKAAALLPTPDHKDVSYGLHERNVFDLWLAKPGQPTPLVVFIHGGGFVAGDKSKLDREALQRALAAGASVMAINYRFLQHAPIQDILRDAARAIQFVRLHAAKYNVDPKRVGCFGASAGAGTSLWLAVHDDLAVPKSGDPVLRQSSRISAAACINGQVSYDMTEWDHLVGEFKKEWRHSDAEQFEFYHFKSETDFKTPDGRRVLDDCSMYRQLSQDDPPILMNSMQPGGEPANRGAYVHHPRHALAIKKRGDEVGAKVQTHLQADGPGNAAVMAVEFLLKNIGAAPRETASRAAQGH